MPSLKIITGANDSYILTLIDFIHSYMRLNLQPNTLIVYDLGLNEHNRKIILEQNKNFIFKKIDYSLYPEHVDVNKFSGLYCSYAFKPIIIYNEANNVDNIDSVLIWMDSANRFNINTLNHIYASVKKHGLYTPISNVAGSIESVELNHPSTVSLFGLSIDEHKNLLSSVSGNLIGLNYNMSAGKCIIDEWYDKSLNKEFIIPEGSSRNNHRQDQTLLSVIMFLYEKENNIIFDKHLVGEITFWNKRDKSTVQEGHFPFKLFEKHTGKQLAIIFCRTLAEANQVYRERKNMNIDLFNAIFTVTY